MSLTLLIYGGTLAAGTATFIVKGVPLLRQWLRGRSSETWPWTNITVESGEVNVAATNRNGDPFEWELKVEYSYTVEGQRYFGTYRHWLDRKADAEGLLKNLQEVPTPVRYQPGKPEKSVLDPYRDAKLEYER